MLGSVGNVDQAFLDAFDGRRNGFEARSFPHRPAGPSAARLWLAGIPT